MGVLKGSISYAKFYVQGPLPDDFRDSFLQSVSLRAFRPLTVDEDDETRVGWVPVARPFEPDASLDHDAVFFDSYLNLALRIDQWRFPAPVFKSAFSEAEKKYLEKRGREKLSRREKEELRVMVSKKLRRQFSPVMKAIDLSWNLETGVLRFWNQSTKAHEQLFEIFEKTFPVKLVPASPYTSALEAGLPEPRLEAMMLIEPAVFHAPHN